MGVSTVTAARILKGQLQNRKGEESLLEMEKFPYVALAKVSPPGHPWATRHPPQGHGRAAGIDREPKLGHGRATGAGSGAHLLCQGPARGNREGGREEAARPWEATGTPPLLLQSFC